MEKKGNFFNQIAIISDLLEKINLESESRTVIFELKEEEFNRVYGLVTDKTKQNIKSVKNKFPNSRVFFASIVFAESTVILSLCGGFFLNLTLTIINLYG